MIYYIKKDITDVVFGIVAHGVNGQKKMNSGVAKAIRAKWPKVYEEYMKNGRGKEVLGTAQIISVNEDNTLWVANCYTQLFYGYGGGKYASTQAIAQSLNQVMSYASLTSLPIYMPKIGCGLGGLGWEHDVKPIVEDLSLLCSDVVVCVCEI